MKSYLCKLKTNKDITSQEFLKIPKDLTAQKYIPSIIHSNKNNFSNILACDSTRVKLKDHIIRNYILHLALISRLNVVIL